jgi:hypothetical protein
MISRQDETHGIIAMGLLNMPHSQRNGRRGIAPLGSKR